MKIEGKYTSAKVMVDDIDEATKQQIIDICSQKAFEDAEVCIMADAHAGKGVPIGFTAICDKNIVIPNLVGVDIGCSVSAHNLGNIDIDFQKLDDVIRKNIPSGNKIRETPYKELSEVLDAINDVRTTADEIGMSNRTDYYINSIGTLGSGNHFISVEVDENENKWLLIHTGSRNFGYAICDYHQNKAIAKLTDQINDQYKTELQSIEPSLRQQWIKDHSKNIVDPKYAYLSGEDAKLYLKHMQVAQKFAKLNHVVIYKVIRDAMDFDDIDNGIFTSHNYIEEVFTDEILIRKGAIASKINTRVLIPLNMADGTLICKGKGNIEWNFSAPHGAGRIMSRNTANSNLSLDEFKQKMEGIWSSCVKQSTLDESPMAYKNADFIKSNIGEVVDIQHHLKPIYNFKAN